MNDLATNAHDAGRLIACALRPRQTPWTNREYAELLQHYDADLVFARLVDNVCEGMGLRIIEVSENGLIFGATETSPFRLSADDYKPNMQAEERVLHGVIQVAIAAFTYPKADVLDQDDAVQSALISPMRLAAYLRQFAEAEQARIAEQPDHDETEERRVWRDILARAVTKETAARKESATSLTGLCLYALKYLERQGLMRLVDETKENGIYQGTTAYRIRLKYRGAHDLLDQLRMFAAQRNANNSN